MNPKIISITISLIFIIFLNSCSTETNFEDLSFSLSQLTLERGMAGISSFTLDDNIYVLTYTDSATLYKITSNELEKILDGKDFGFIKRGSFNTEIINGKVYIIGGAPDKTQSGCSAKVSTGSEYDCSTDEVWIFENNELTKSTPMNNPREVLASGVVNNKIYVLGGWFPNEQNTNDPDIEVFDGTAWNIISYSGTYYPVRSAAYATVESKIYLFGGCLKTNENNPSTFSCNTVLTQIFDTETNTFSQGTSMPLEGRHFSGQHTAVRGKYIYVFGGATALSKEIFDDVAIYDTEFDTWEILENKMTTKRKSTGAAILDNQLYIFGGITPNEKDKTATNTIEIGTFESNS